MKPIEFDIEIRDFKIPRLKGSTNKILKSIPDLEYISSSQDSKGNGSIRFESVFTNQLLLMVFTSVCQSGKRGRLAKKAGRHLGLPNLLRLSVAFIVRVNDPSDQHKHRKNLELDITRQHITTNYSFSWSVDPDFYII